VNSIAEHRLKEERTFLPWVICGILLVATLLNYMDRQVLAVTLPTLKQQFHLTEGRVGMIEGSFGYAFAVGSILFGWIADRVGPRFLYPILLFGWSIAGIATSWAPQPWVTELLERPGDSEGTGIFRWMLICRIILGACEAGHWPCALLTVRAILTPKDRTLGNGILQSGASIGAIIVPIYVEFTDRMGASWEFPFWSIGVAGMTWIPLWFFFTARQNLREPLLGPLQGASIHTQAAEESIDGNFIRRLIVLALVVASITLSWQFLRAWMALFLQDYHHYTKEMTRALMSGYFIAADVGCILGGVLVTMLVTRGWEIHSARKLGYFLFTLMTAFAALIPLVGNGWLMVTFLFLAGAGILGLHPFYYAMTQEISKWRMGMVSGGLAAFGWVVSSTAQIYLGKQIEATKSYQLGLIMVGLAPFVGLIAIFTLWPRSRQETTFNT
jgi:ACS family hexuronate transporter-like MFS transporter